MQNEQENLRIIRNILGALNQMPITGAQAQPMLEMIRFVSDLEAQTVRVVMRAQLESEKKNGEAAAPATAS